MASDWDDSLETAWYARVPTTAATRLGSVRRFGGLEVGQTADGEVWLRGKRTDPRLDSALRSIGHLALYAEAAGDRLRRRGESVPARRKPPIAEWKHIADWLAVALPAAKYPDVAHERVRLRLVRSDGAETPPSMVRIPLPQWFEYAMTAPAVRLSRLRFAASVTHAFVLGEPLPPIPGEPFYVLEGVAAPVGYRWSPALDAGVVRDLFGLRGDDIGVLEADGVSRVIPGLDWVAANRSAVRLTEEALRDVP